ncbi:macrolide transporter subunit [Fuerstiella marisgermanici]|uniref:Macrolide transporter subunit n=2 Tax=Fuerstiella marisgermanici TaxID=1891926 RepID=A0A1P8WJC6_9PLAN|nr:macrolide transporter subunit [Fuerstiella marisgermanici]
MPCPASLFRAVCLSLWTVRARAQQPSSSETLVPQPQVSEIRCKLFLLAVLAMAVCPAPTRAQQESSEVKATGCFLRLKDEANVPALESGLLQSLDVELGDTVKSGQLLATMEHREALLAVQLAEIDHDIAARRDKESVAVEIAQSAVDEAAQSLKQAKIDLQISNRIASFDTAIQQAEVAYKLAREEYDRALKSKNEFSTSVSAMQMARHQSALDKSRLDIEQAKNDQSVQALRSTAKSATVDQQQVAAKRLNLELQQASSDRGIGTLTAQRTKTSLAVAKERLDRRRIHSPLSGIVAERLKNEGEWVEAGEPVLRVIRMDRLLVEGYVNADLIEITSRGRAVRVEGTARGRTVSVEGRIIYVSPEIDSVNQEVQVKAEIENPDLVLRPGQPVKMVVLPGGEVAGR